MFDWIMSAALHSRKEVIVPDVKGKSIYDALRLVSSLDLGLKIEGEELNQDLPAGTVIRQTPYPGITVREGKLIRVIVCQGGEVIFVPKLIGQPVRSARIAIRSAGLNLGEESSKFSAVYEKEQVITQDPGPEKIVERDSLVNLVVSAGLPPDNIKLVPNFAGKNIEDVKSWAAENKIELNISEEETTSFSMGTVMSQKPEPDDELKNGEKISLTVAKSSLGRGPNGKMFVYDIPAGNEDRKIKLTLIDDTGEKEIFNGTKASGTKLEIPIDPKGQAKARVFINGVLVEEREIE
ncbi:MAG: PASTA domain-containing protein [Elusimicrobia bacterium]|nr:PASTA domain-containing protein [Candidatus Liberimonas magnetica]